MRSTALMPALFILLVHGASPATSFQCEPDGLQQEMNACAERDYKVADVALTAKYTTVLTGLSPPKQVQLRQEQKAWLKDRDSRCREDVKPSEGGSIWALEYFSCLTTATQLRTVALRGWESNR